MANEMLKADLIARLQRLDEEVDLTYDNNNMFECIIVGGGALILTNKIDIAKYP